MKPEIKVNHSGIMPPHCPNCGFMMKPMGTGLENSKNPLMRQIWKLVMSYHVQPYECMQCGKIEIYRKGIKF